MKRFAAMCMLVLMSVACNGCAINQFSDDQQGPSDKRTFDSDEYRELHREWQKYWNGGGGNQSQGYRIHGGVVPASSSI